MSSKKVKSKPHPASISHRSSQASGGASSGTNTPSDSSVGASRGKSSSAPGSSGVSSSSAAAATSSKSSSGGRSRASRPLQTHSAKDSAQSISSSPSSKSSSSKKQMPHAKTSVSRNGQSKTKVNSRKSTSKNKSAASVAGKAQGKEQEKVKTEKEDDSEGMSIFTKDPKMVALLEKKQYAVLKRIAHGAFGQVYKGAKTDSSGHVLEDQPIAIKVIEMSRLQPVFREKYLPQELAALTHLQHKNIIRVHDIFRANERLYIAMDFAPNGDLSGWLKKNGPMKEKLAAYWFRQVVCALSHVHASLRMAHRDIKLDNVLLDANHEAKLSDFGFAKECWDSKRHCVILSQTICGTQPYFAPQLVDHVPYNAYLADVWAMGVMCFVMLNYRFPFHFDQDPNVWLLEMTNWPTFIRTRFQPTVNSKAVELVVAMLNPEEKARMTLHEALKHEWLAKVTDKTAPIDA